MLIYCAKCEAANSDQAPVCGECGHSLMAERVEPTEDPSPPASTAKPIPTNLKPCQACGNMVSTRTKTCPQCGRPDPHESEMFLKAVSAIGFIIIVPLALLLMGGFLMGGLMCLAPF